jgi:regulator of cell morphogenesis and NO signaling
MKRTGKYRETDTMTALITDDYQALLVMTRFGIGLGFGDKNIGEVCTEHAVDTDTFLAIVNLMANGNRPPTTETPQVSPDCLIDYLSQSHSFFLKFRLPEMRRKLAEALNEGEDDLNRAVTGYFDNFVSALKKHTNNEDRKIFPYIKALMKGENPDRQTIAISRQHENIQNSLSEFKTVLIKYYPARHADKINSFLFDVFNCERDLASHNAVEEYLFQPFINALEQKSHPKI